MLQHLLLMNLVAPLMALALRTRLPTGLWRSWPLATATQLALLWGWHSPTIMDRVMLHEGLHLAMQISLFAAALWFWSALVNLEGSGRWRAIVALIVTGKLFCLLGALLVFSPRLLFGPDMAATGHLRHGVFTLSDQHLAGLIMTIACPLTYVAAGVVISARWFLEIDRRTARHV